MLGFRSLAGVIKQPLEFRLEMLHRQKLVQRRVEQADRDRKPAHRPEDALEVGVVQLAEAVQRGAEVALRVLELESGD